MGLGIEHRYGRCAKWWDPHLKLTRSFVSEHIESVGTLAVLGAGRLLDIEISTLLKSCDELHLFDLDPGVLQVWRQQVPSSERHRVIFRCEDVTSSIKAWHGELARGVREHRIKEVFDKLTAVTPYWVNEDFDGIISLNLLGQIPLYWRDRALRLLGPASDDFQAPLQVTMTTLQRAHLEAVTNARVWSMFISDTEYYYYRLPDSNWCVEPALFMEVSNCWSALLNVAEATDRWWWHLAPQFVERHDYGEIHRVEALFLRAL